MSKVVGVISHIGEEDECCASPTNTWVPQQLREAFPYNPTEKYLIFDRAANFKLVQKIGQASIQWFGRSVSISDICIT